jgi:hypothetical protein
MAEHIVLRCFREGFEVDAKLHDVDLWADEEPVEDVF